MKLASSATMSGIIELISKFYGGAHITLHDSAVGTWDVHNAKGLIASTHVRMVKSRYVFESKEAKS